MSDENSVLAQADALIRKRRRSFVAGAAGAGGKAAAEEDVPTLTERVEEDAEAVADLVDLIASTSDTRLAQALHQRGELLDAELEDWLTARLPLLIKTAIDNLAPRLIEEVSAQARMELQSRLLEALYHGRLPPATENPPEEA